MVSFEIDPNPGKPKILFIGLANSTHTLAWINLLAKSEFNPRLFAKPYEPTPPIIVTKTYLSVPAPENPDNQFQYINQSMKFGRKHSDPYSWLAAIITAWHPDIIHTLGLFDDQGGLPYYKVRQQFRLGGIGRWVLQLRGGSDIALRKHNPETAKLIREILEECDEIITDNYVNIKYIKGLGLGDKIASITPVPGTGGLNTNISIENLILPSKKKRIILWPKAYDCPWSKALPVLEALILSWKAIQPCKIYISAATPETEMWFWTLPEEIRLNCFISQRIPRSELLDIMRKARVLLAPSLVDGVPNSLYEAMVNATFPIISPLDTLQPIVKNETNVLFARNLYPEEICQALVRAMSDDNLVDNAAIKNLALVKKIASRDEISRKVNEYYHHIARQYRKDNLTKSAIAHEDSIPFLIQSLGDKLLRLLKRLFHNTI